MTRAEQKKDVIGAIVTLVFFVAAFILVGSAKPEAQIWPKFICILGAVFSILQFIFAYFKWAKLPKEEPLTDAQKKANKEKYFRAVIVVVITALWIFLIDIVGFIVTNTLAVFALMCVPKKPESRKELVIYITVAVVLAVALWLGFGKLLGARLPSGFLI